MGSALEQLTPADQAFVAAYTDIDNPTTFSNGTRSYMASRPNAGYGTARTTAAKVLAKPEMKTAVQEILDEHGASYKVRLRALIDGALGRTTDEIVTVRKDKDGNVIEETTVTKPVPHSSRTKYHQMLLELSGDADRAKAESKIRTDAMIAASKRIMKRIKAESRVEAHEATQEALDIESAPTTDATVSEYIEHRASLAAVAAQIRDMRSQGMDDSAVLDALSEYADVGAGGSGGDSGGLEGGEAPASSIPSPPTFPEAETKGGTS